MLVSLWKNFVNLKELQEETLTHMSVRKFCTALSGAMKTNTKLRAPTTGESTWKGLTKALRMLTPEFSFDLLPLQYTVWRS